MYRGPAPGLGTEDTIPEGCGGRRPGLNNLLPANHLIISRIMLNEEGQSATSLQLPSLPVWQSRKDAIAIFTGEAQTGGVAPAVPNSRREWSSDRNPGLPGPRRWEAAGAPADPLLGCKTAPESLPTRPQGAAIFPKAGFSGFPPLLGIRPGPLQELRSSPY